MTLTTWTNRSTPVQKAINLQSLCLSLAKAETEQAVINILNSASLWESEGNWKNYGDTENNFSVIGSQQSKPEAAIVEKLINSVDAMLMRECLRRKINPESSRAPENIVDALEQFFQVSQGSLYNASISERRELAENITFVATGQASSPCYSIIDKGEGQTPLKMPHTFLSLSASNKLRIRFVQGKFNMGGTGVFQFTGHNNLQLIISKRDPEIAKLENADDKTKDCWGFTVVRRENPKEGRRSSVYTYLTIDEKIPVFKAESLPLLPGEYPEPYMKPLEWGTYIKLYEYQMPGRLKSNVVFDLYDRICLMLPKVALPVRFFERRPGYKGHTMETTMSGLSVRLFEDRRGNLEEGFPSSSTLSVLGEKMNCQIFVFKKGQAEKYRKDEGIIFTVNGQTHGHIPATFFNHKAVGMAYLADSILVTIDCTDFSGRAREDFFMNSRDRLRSGDLEDEIGKKMGELLSSHPGLRALREKRRKEEIQNKLEDSKPLKEVLEDILKKSPTLASLLIPGFKLKTPFDLRKVGTADKFVGKEFPTYFTIRLDEIKQCPINSRFRVQYITDAANDYFERERLRGEFSLSVNGEEVTDRILNLWNGLATLTVSLPEKTHVGDVLIYKSVVSDPTQFRPFESQIQVKVLEECKKNGDNNQHRNRVKPPSDTNGSDRLTASNLSLPQVIEVHKEQWEEHGFTERSALKVKDAGDGSYDYFVNMDNLYLLSEIKTKSNEDAQLLENKYKYALVLIGLALLGDSSKGKNEENDDKDISQEVLEISAKLAQIVLPMISYLGELEIGS